MKTTEEYSLQPVHHRVGAICGFWDRARMAGLVLGIAACASASAVANPGDLDPTFGTNGMVVLHFNPFTGERGLGVVVQHDGKIILGADSNYRDAAARFTPSGRLDTTFALHGILNSLLLGTGTSFCSCIALDASDRFILAGGLWHAPDPKTFFHMRRYSANGVPDTAFGTGGETTIDMGEYALVTDALVLLDGKILLIGPAQTGMDRHFGMVRCTPDGFLDPTFGAGGRVITSFGAGDEWPSGVAIQPDGKIVVAGYSDTSSGVFRFALARYLSNGALDQSFNGTGKVASSLGPYSQATSIAIQRDGKIVAGGWINMQMALARFNSDGTLDTSFGPSGTGVVMAREGTWDSWQKVAVQPDGKILAYGHSANSPYLVVARYTAAGIPDAGFGRSSSAFPAGAALVPIGTKMSEATGLMLQPDGRILIAATAYETNTYSNVAVARLLNDGAAPPRITCPPPAVADCGEPVTLATSVASPGGLPLTIIWEVNGQDVETNSFPDSGSATNFVASFAAVFPIGSNSVNVTVTDSESRSDACTTSVVVVDRSSPVVASAGVVPDTLWPPNHRFVQARVTASVTDNCDAAPTWRIVQVTSNDSGKSHDPDWIITGDSTVLLRAERSGSTPRIYSILLQAIDASGNVSELRTVSVTVPVSGKPIHEPIRLPPRISPRASRGLF